MYGGRISLLGVAEALIVYLVLGLPAGLVAGTWEVGSTVWSSGSQNLSFAVPQIVVVLAVLAILGEKSSVAMITLGILGAPGLMRIARGATMAVEREQYIGRGTCLRIDSAVEPSLDMSCPELRDPSLFRFHYLRALRSFFKLASTT